MSHEGLGNLVRRAAEYSFNGTIDSGDLLRATVDFVVLQPRTQRAILWAIFDTVGWDRPSSMVGNCDLSPDAQELLTGLPRQRPHDLWRNIIEKRVGISDVILKRAGL